MNWKCQLITAVTTCSRTHDNVWILNWFRIKPLFSEDCLRNIRLLSNFHQKYNLTLESHHFHAKAVRLFVLRSLCSYSPIHQQPYSLPYDCHQVQHFPASPPQLFFISPYIWKHKLAGWSLAEASHWMSCHIMPSVIVWLKSYSPAVLLLSLPLPNFSAVCILPQGQV